MQEYILFNGKTIQEINAKTDVSGYKFSTFPSNADDKYKLPIIVFENNNAIELKFHNDYLKTAGDSLEITVKKGLSIVNGQKEYVVSKDVCYALTGNVWGDKNRLYTVTYYLNGEVYGEVEQFPHNSPLILRDDVETEKGFVFSGWEYPPTAGIVQNMEIHGYIRPIRYNVTYHVNGGINDSRNPIVYYATDGEIVLQDAVKDGAVFKGWYTSKEYAEKVESLSADNLGNIELYALFEKDKTGKDGCSSVAFIGGEGVLLAGLLTLLRKKRKGASTDSLE